MSIPPHYLHLYGKPKIGVAPLGRYQAFKYQHKIAAVGGFDTANCELALSRDEAEIWLGNNLGYGVAVYADNPAEPIWEGFINRMTFQSGGYKRTISLDKLFNRIKVQYANGATPATTTAVNDADSQALYGIKQGQFDAHIQYTGTGSQVPTALRDQLIALNAWPKASTTVTTGGGKQSLFTLECLGFYHTLSWEDWSFASNSAVNASVAIKDILTALANGATFFNNADQLGVVTNAAFNQNKLSRNGNTAWQFMKGIQEAGDGAGTPWVMGITAKPYGNANLEKRTFYYRPANLNVEYTANQYDGQRIRNVYGALVDPWRVRPDRGIRLNDVLLGWSGLGDDPRESYLELIAYDADKQSVTWKSSDNVETEGAFQLRDLFKSHGSRFGATVRNTE